MVGLLSVVKEGEEMEHCSAALPRYVSFSHVTKVKQTYSGKENDSMLVYTATWCSLTTINSHMF